MPQLPTRVLQDVSSSGGSFHKQTEAHLVKTHHIQDRYQTLPTAGKEPLQMTGLKDKAAKTIQQQSAHNTHQRHSLKHQAVDTMGHLHKGHYCQEQET